MNIEEINQLKDLIVQPLQDQHAAFLRLYEQNQEINNECHKAIKKDLENLKGFKSKVLGFSAAISMVITVIGSWLWGEFTGRK